MAQDHLERSLRGTVAQALERRAHERRPGDTLVAEDQLRADRQPASRRELTQLVDLALRPFPGCADCRSRPGRRSRRSWPASAATAPSPSYLLGCLGRDAATFRNAETVGLREPRVGETIADITHLNPQRHLGLDPRAVRWLDSAAAVNAPIPWPRRDAPARAATITDTGRRTVNVAVGSGTATPSGAPCAARDIPQRLPSRERELQLEEPSSQPPAATPTPAARQPG